VKKTLLSMLALGLWLAAANFCPAQAEMKPLVIVSVAGYDKLLTDVGVIGQLSGNPDLGTGLDMMIKLATQGKGLAGLDTKQPWAGVVMTDGQRAFTQYGYVPVTDLKQLMDIGKTLPQMNDAITLNGDVYEIRIDGPAGSGKTCVKQIGNWAVVTEKSEDFANAPADPLKLLGDLPQRYDLAVRASVKNTPKEYRDQTLAMFQAVPEGGLPQMADESDDDYALRVSITRQAVQRLTQMANELDDVVLGWAIDPAAKSTHFDIELTAQPGTKLAEQFGAITPGKTNFAGLLAPKAAVTANWTRTLADSEVAEFKTALALMRKSLLKGVQDKGLTESQAKLAADVLGDLVDVAEKTVESKKTDSGLMVILDADAATLVAGVAVSDGAKLEKAVKRLVDSVQQEDAELAKSIKLNAETHEGVRFHSFTVPTPDQKLATLVGDTLEVVVGIGDDRVLIAAGRDAAGKLKQAIDQSKGAAGKEVPPLGISLAATPIVKFIAQVDEDESVVAAADKLTEALKKAGDKDHVLITVQPVAQGFRLRLEIEEGLLKALISLNPMMESLGVMPPR
jgi:hypothetical protein